MDITTRNIEKKIAAGQKGFTLIEIIAVLVILGMLAAVAVPKYLSMQQAAANQTLNGALASGISQASLEYSNQLLQGVDPTTAVGNAATACTAAHATMDDYMFSYVAAGSTITVTVTNGATAAGLSVWNNRDTSLTFSKAINFQ